MVYQKFMKNLRNPGLTPKLHIVDNEVSEDLKQLEDLKQYFEDSDIQFQLVPPHIHWMNAA